MDEPRVKFLREFSFWFEAIGLFLLGGVALAAAVVAYYAFTLPSLDALERIAPSLITQVYARDSTLLREYYAQRRLWSPLDSIPGPQVEAVLAIEDKDFFRHGGVD